LAGRFEPPHDLLSLPGLAVCVFNSVIQALVGSMISIRGQILYRLYVAAQLVRHDDTRFTELLDQSGEKALGSLGVAASLNQNVEYVTIGINGPPEPEFLSTDRDDGLIHMPLIVRLGPVSANAVGKMSAKAVDPETNRFPAHDNTAFSKKVWRPVISLGSNTGC